MKRFASKSSKAGNARLALEAELSQHVQLSRQHQQEAQIWELLQSTLTEGCWDITVANGDVQRSRQSACGFSNQFRILMGYATA